MAKRPVGGVQLRGSADEICGDLLSERFIEDLIDKFADRKDCEIEHLIDLAEMPHITAWCGKPKDPDGHLWGGGAIEKKFKALTLQEQFDTMEYMLKRANYGNDNANGALAWFISWLEFPTASMCWELCELVGEDPGPAHRAVYEALKCLVEKENLFATCTAPAKPPK